ncbi:MAG: Mut7-C RNAse domain-containing protein [Candidatus Latescibacterota bacterium]|jgi:uncharacterized protein with PIN domain
MTAKTAQFRFYAELNDFLRSSKRQRTFPYRFSGNPSVKDAIEAIGVPHPEVDLIVVNGESVGFDRHLSEGDKVSVYPVFESLDISPVVRLRPKPLRETRFILDVHLGKLARLLRMLGFDTLYRSDYEDQEIVAIAMTERRIILTRDVELLKANAVTHGFWIRAIVPNEQVGEVLERLDLYSQIRPFMRCMVCNATIQPVEKEEVLESLPENVREKQDEFFICRGCDKVYWKGSHYQDMMEQIQSFSGRTRRKKAGKSR